MEEIIEAITQAGRNRHTLTIQYVKKTTGEEVTHEVEPYSIKGETFYGRRIDIEPPKGTRAFLLENIRMVQELQRTFEPLWDVDF